MIITCSRATICVDGDGIARCNLAILPVSNYDRTVLIDSYASSVGVVICVIYFSDVVLELLVIVVSSDVLDPRSAFQSESQKTARILLDGLLKSS